MIFNKDVLKIDSAREAERIVNELRRQVRQVMHRAGAAVGISGGVDSAVVLALAVRAFGPERVTALILPEKDSDPLSEQLARDLAAKLGVTPLMEKITSALEGFACYRRRDEAIRRVVPEYDPARGHKAKLVLPRNLLEEGSLNVFSVTSRISGRPRSHLSSARTGVSPGRGGLELQATRAHGNAVLPCRGAELRGARHRQQE